METDAVASGGGNLRLQIKGDGRSEAEAVTIKNFRFTLSKGSATHGKVKFVVTNKDSTKHDFKIAGKATKMLGKNKSDSITVTLKKGKRTVKALSRSLRAGRTSVTLAPLTRRRRAGRYTLLVTAVDTAGNAADPARLKLRLRKH